MTEMAINVLSSVLLLTGAAFGILGGMGLLRFPDFYTRQHAAGMTDTLCALLIVLGLVLQSGLSMLTIKLALILLFLLFTAPVAGHALARASLLEGHRPVGDSTELDRAKGESSSNT